MGDLVADEALLEWVADVSADSVADQDERRRPVAPNGALVATCFWRRWIVKRHMGCKIHGCSDA